MGENVTLSCQAHEVQKKFSQILHTSHNELQRMYLGYGIFFSNEMNCKRVNFGEHSQFVHGSLFPYSVNLARKMWAYVKNTLRLTLPHTDNSIEFGGTECSYVSYCC